MRRVRRMPFLQSKFRLNSLWQIEITVLLRAYCDKCNRQVLFLLSYTEKLKVVWKRAFSFRRVSKNLSEIGFIIRFFSIFIHVLFIDLVQNKKSDSFESEGIQSRPHGERYLLRFKAFIQYLLKTFTFDFKPILIVLSPTVSHKTFDPTEIISHWTFHNCSLLLSVEDKTSVFVFSWDVNYVILYLLQWPLLYLLLH